MAQIIMLSATRPTLKIQCTTCQMMYSLTHDLEEKKWYLQADCEHVTLDVLPASGVYQVNVKEEVEV